MIVRRSAVPRRLAAVAGALALIAVSTFGAAAHSSAAQAATGSSVTKSKTVSRTFLDDGKTTVVDKRTVSFTVDTTKDLHSLQLVNVSWKGAMPTGGLVADQNSDLAENEEHSFAIFECRGDDTAAHPITPADCWTQFADERFSYGYDDPPWPAWRADSQATTAERQAIVGSPEASKLTSDCKSSLFGTTVQRWVPFDAADGTVYPGGPFGCQGLPPEAAPANLSSGVTLPSNETFGVTDDNGTGSATFDVFSGEDHASLGCSQTVACSIVAIPIEGLSCDPSGSKLPADQRPDADGAEAAKEACEAGPLYKPGQQLPSQGSGQPSVDGSLWWSPSNFDNRITVPLTFAPPDDACNLNSSTNPIDVYGSELMIQAAGQWNPHFCLDKNLFNIKHVQTPEPEARNLLAVNNIEAAYTSDPPDSGSPYPYPTVNAPVAVTGFGIAFTVDDANGKPLANLRLDARLLAKLLTESYPAINAVQQGHPGMMNNPLNITYDPEFQALNPTAPETTTLGAATLFALSSDSDVMEALTSYINADPEARAWLNGTPDPWGMTVNPAYKNISLPVNNWELKDTYEPLDIYKPGLNDCLAINPVPYLPQVASPTQHLFTIGQQMEFALSPSQTTCVLPSPIPGDTAGAKLVAAGRQASGHHMLMGMVSLGDAQREGLSVASLESYTDPSAPTKFTDATGRTFVNADDAGMLAATRTLKPDSKTGTWPVDYDALRSAANKDAYPGTMVVYTALPTYGMSTPSDAAKFGKFLTYAVGPGQTPGVAIGDLPPGYLPMTSANGMGGMVAYTLRAAKAVTAQQGYLPSLTKPDPVTTKPGGGTTTSTGSSSGSSSGSNSGGSTSGGSTSGGTGGSIAGGTSGGTAGATSGGTTGGTTGGATTAPVTGGKSSTAPSSASGSSGDQPVNASEKTARTSSGIGSWALPALLLIAIAALGVSLAVRIGMSPRR